eukprot:sb/3474898/
MRIICNAVVHGRRTLVLTDSISNPRWNLCISNPNLYPNPQPRTQITALTHLNEYRGTANSRFRPNGRNLEFAFLTCTTMVLMGMSNFWNIHSLVYFIVMQISPRVSCFVLTLLYICVSRAGHAKHSLARQPF